MPAPPLAQVTFCCCVSHAGTSPRTSLISTLETTAGIHASTGPWLKARGVAAIGSDAISDVMPSGVESVFNPMHTLINAALGMPIFDHLQFDQAA